MSSRMVSLFFLLSLCYIYVNCNNFTTIPLGCLLPMPADDPSSGEGRWLAPPYNAMKLAVEEINNSTTLLPNFKIDFVCNWSYYSSPISAEIGVYNVNRKSVAMLGIIYSSEATPLGYVVSSTDMPIISLSATAARLSDPTLFPSFHRMIPSDNAQIGPLLSVCEYYQWKNLVVVYSTDDYGRSFYEDMSAINQSVVDVTYFPVPYSDEYNDTETAFMNTAQLIKDLDVRIIYLMVTPLTNLLTAWSKVNPKNQLLRSNFVIIVNQDFYFDGDANWAKQWLGGIIQLNIPSVTNELTVQLQQALNVSDPDDSTFQNAYDSVYIVANAIDTLTKVNNTNLIPSNDQIISQIRKTFLPNGASGPIQFCDSERLYFNWTILNFAIGAMEPDPVLSAVTNNICPTQGSVSRYTIQPIGSQSVVFANGFTTVPKDKQYAVIKGLSLGAVAASLALILIGIVLIILSFILTNINARTRVIKGSSVLFCNLILLGVLIALIGLLVETLYDRSEAYACMLVPGLLALSFDVTFGSLFAKTWRLVKIFQNAQHLKRSVITNAQVFLPVFALILFDALVMSLWAGLDRPQIDIQPDPIRAYTLVQRCDMKEKTTWFSLLILPKLGVLIYGMQISYQVRNIDKIFRESNSIAAAIIALFLCGAITTPILLLVWQQIDAAQILLTIGVTLSLISVALVLFVPKFWRIYTEEGESELDKSATLDMSTMSATSRSWKPDSRGAGGGPGSHAEDLHILKKSGNNNNHSNRTAKGDSPGGSKHDSILPPEEGSPPSPTGSPPSPTGSPPSPTGSPPSPTGFQVAIATGEGTTPTSSSGVTGTADEFYVR